MTVRTKDIFDVGPLLAGPAGQRRPLILGRTSAPVEQGGDSNFGNLRQRAPAGAQFVLRTAAAM